MNRVVGDHSPPTGACESESLTPDALQALAERTIMGLQDRSYHFGFRLAAY